MLHASEAEERRAKNIIWNAAGDYDFTPDFLSFTPEGAADLYLNCIIGAVHRYYDYRPLKDLFVRIGQLPDAALYEGLLWFGLAHSVYPAAKEDRPVLETLRLEYARDVVSHSVLTGTRSFWNVSRPHTARDCWDRLPDSVAGKSALWKRYFSVPLWTPAP